MENWTAGEWIKVISCVLILVAAATKLATGKLCSCNVHSIRVLLTMIEEDRKEFFCGELGGNNVQDALKAELETLKQNTTDLYRMNKRDKKCIRVHKLIERYHQQLVDIEQEAMKDLEDKVLSK